MKKTFTANTANTANSPNSPTIHCFGNIYKNDNFTISTSNSKKYVNYINTKTNEQVPDFLNRIAETFSPVHAALLKLKTNMIIGNGIMPNMENPIVAARIAEFTKILNNIDGHDNDINSQLKLYASNAAIHEACVFKVTKNKLGLPRFIAYEPTSYYRCAELVEESYMPMSFFISREWSKVRPRYVEYPRYEKNNKKDPTQVYVSKFSTLSNPYYNVPGYHSALKSINIVSELEILYLNSIQNGFHNAGILTMQGVTNDPDILDEKVKYIEKQWTGSGNAGKTMLIEVNDMAQKPAYDAITKSADHQTYYELKTQANSSIITSHGAFATELAGIDSGGMSLGGDSNKILISYQLFKTQITDKLQSLIVDAYNKIFKDYGFGDNAIYIADKSPLNGNTMPDGVTDQIADTAYAGPLSSLTNLTGKQMIQLQRIMRKHEKGQLSKEQALILLKPFGLSEEDMMSMLSIDDTETDTPVV